ncbi:MAG: hypothetical protein EXR79_08130 [Myxococcales bacterium]|nr:hypothetical protein [Myxococcales bacterium]
MPPQRGGCTLAVVVVVAGALACTAPLPPGEATPVADAGADTKGADLAGTPANPTDGLSVVDTADAAHVPDGQSGAPDLGAALDAAVGDAAPTDFGPTDATPDAPAPTDGATPDAGAAPDVAPDVPNPLVVACVGKATGSDCSTDGCTSGQKCAQGLCLGGQPKVCEDGNECTVDGCAAPTGCTFLMPPPGQACDDDEKCTSVSECQEGACVGTQNVCLKDKCIDTQITCGNTKMLPVTADPVTKEFQSFKCGAGIATPGPEFVFTLDTPCNATALVIVRTWGKGSPGPTAPPAQQPTHLYLLDTAASALACGMAMSCTEVTAAIPCGKAGPLFKPGCVSEWAFPLLFQVGVPRRLVVDTLAAGWVTDVEVSVAACGCGKPGKCGDATCNNKEDKGNCLADCGTGTGCGNGVCNPAAGETPKGCPADCISPTCGNAKCDPGELASNCPSDCPLLVCGDGVCSATMAEACATCPVDCGTCKPKCGDMICKTPEEDCTTCKPDCGPCPNEVACGNTICQPDWGESCSTCPVDCIGKGACKCGDNVCNSGNFESKWNCPGDCFKPCGDGVCEVKLLETKASCPQDCDATCGDKVCTPLQETWLTCAKDCPAECGNLLCEPWSGETAAVCKNDCLSVCGNAKCEPHGGEGQLFCFEDCK